MFTIREDKKAKKLENKKKEAEIEEFKKDEIIKDWKNIAEERKLRCDELKADVSVRDAKIAEKDEIISELKTKLDEKNTYCAISEMLRCETVACPDRKPPFGMKEIKLNESFEQ